MNPEVIEKVKKWLEAGRIDPSKAVFKHHPDDEGKFKLVRQKVKILAGQSRAAKREKMLKSIDKLRSMRSVVNESDEELRKAERLNRTGGLDNLKLSRMKERVQGESPFKRFTKRLEFLKDASKKFNKNPEKRDKAIKNNNAKMYSSGSRWDKKLDSAYKKNTKLGLLSKTLPDAEKSLGDPKHKRQLERRALLNAIRSSNEFNHPLESPEGQRANDKANHTFEKYRQWINKRS